MVHDEEEAEEMLVDDEEDPTAPDEPPDEPPPSRPACQLLASPFATARRVPTLFVERPPGQPARQVRPTLAYEGAAPQVHMQLNANSVRNAFKRSGFAVVGNTSALRVLWARHTGDKLWTQLPRGAIVNHFPGSWVLGRKDGLAKALHTQQRRLGAAGPGLDAEYGFFPRTFILPQDRASLERAAERGVLQGGGTLIVKPQNSSRGRGIRLVAGVAEVPHEERLLVQEYVDRPLLLDGRKFDLRMYVLVTSFDPLRCYVFERGMARLASQPYSPVEGGGGYDRFAHLTNFSICKKDAAYVYNTDADADAEGCKWSLAALWRTLAQQGHDVGAVQARIHAGFVKTLIATQPHIVARYGLHFRRRNACFEVFGFDVLLDRELTPYLIEVNVSPDLARARASTSPLDKELKHHLAADMMHLVGVRPPPPPAGGAAADGAWVAPAEDGKEPPLLGRSVTGREPSALEGVPLKQLTDAELECLVEAEEEWWRAEQTAWRCLYPAAPGAVAAFLPLFAAPRYADLLLASYLRRPHRRAELEPLLPRLARAGRAVAKLSRAPSPGAPPVALRRPASQPSQPRPPPDGTRAAAAAAGGGARAASARGGPRATAGAPPRARPHSTTPTPERPATVGAGGLGVCGYGAPPHAHAGGAAASAASHRASHGASHGALFGGAAREPATARALSSREDAGLDRFSQLAARVPPRAVAGLHPATRPPGGGFFRQGGGRSAGAAALGPALSSRALSSAREPGRARLGTAGAAGGGARRGSPRGTRPPPWRREKVPRAATQESL